jgi:hypothetical protein
MGEVQASRSNEILRRRVGRHREEGDAKREVEAKASTPNIS